MPSSMVSTLLGSDWAELDKAADILTGQSNLLCSGDWTQFDQFQTTYESCREALTDAPLTMDMTYGGSWHPSVKVKAPGSGVELSAKEKDERLGMLEGEAGKLRRLIDRCDSLLVWEAWKSGKYPGKPLLARQLEGFKWIVDRHTDALVEKKTHPKLRQQPTDEATLRNYSKRVKDEFGPACQAVLKHLEINEALLLQLWYYLEYDPCEASC